MTNIVVLSTRRLETDFRYHLALALSQMNFRVCYIQMKRSPRVYANFPDETYREFSMPKFLVWFCSTLRSADILFINSTSLSFPLLTRAMKLSTRGTWCFDLHDNLIYNALGFKRVIAGWKQNYLHSWSDFTITASPYLRELFPDAHHLGNASFVQAVPESRREPQSVLILSSIDERFDFTLVGSTADLSADIDFHIYGQILLDNVVYREFLETLCKRPNVHYMGGYQNEDISRLVSRYKVSFAPYLVTESTRYIDPLRYYHCLNGGLALISTSISIAAHFFPDVRVANSPDEASAMIRAALQNHSFALVKPATTWKSKAEELLKIWSAVS